MSSEGKKSRSPGKSFKVITRIMKRTGADKIWSGFIIQVFVSALVMWFLEPGISTYGSALWYCYAVVTTIGFGDVVVQHPVSRVMSVFLSINATLVIALITGVVVNYYIQITELRRKETLTALMDKLEHLPELPKEELEEIAGRVREYNNR